MSSRPHNCCASVCCLGVGCLFFIISLCISLTSLPSLQAVPSRCIVTNITYPKEIPKTLSEAEFEHFDKCDCGKNCISDLGYCVKVYVKLDNVITMAHNEPSQFKKNDKCTFYEDYCMEGESLANRINALDEAYIIASPYINMVNTTKTINCYIYNDNVFINRNLNNLLIIISVTGGVFVVMCICAVVFYYSGEKNEENE